MQTIKEKIYISNRRLQAEIHNWVIMMLIFGMHKRLNLIIDMKEINSDYLFITLLSMLFFIFLLEM